MGNLAYRLIDQHQPDCGTNVVRRLYVRDSTNHKQKFVPCGVICCCCETIQLDREWIIENREQYEEVKRRKPRS
ncbi:MAG TPA: hypothetical protein VF047_00950 [Nitrososphaeraceae archaeon]